MPITDTLRAAVPYFSRAPRALVGRLHRRRPHRHLKGRTPGGKMPRGLWWSGDDRWYERSFPPRRSNELTPLLDGAETFDAMVRAIGEARDYVYIVGWALTPSFALVRGEGKPSVDDDLLARVLATVSERVTVKMLIWRGSTLLFQPTSNLTEQACAELRRVAPRIDVRLDGTARPTHCHHQKALVVDGQIGFVGGLDLTTLEGDRWDRPGHPLRHGRNWHDVALQIRGEAVADLEDNFVQRWIAVTGERDLPHTAAPRSRRIGEHRARSCGRSPRAPIASRGAGEFGIAAAYRDAIARARRFIYLENQYLWSEEIVAALIAALERNRDRPFRVVVVLPARAVLRESTTTTSRPSGLRAADDGRGQFHAYSLYSGGPAAGRFGFGFVPIYVHAKVAIIDDEWLMIGSANLNRRGLATDSEMNAHSVAPDMARALRLRLWSEHLRVEEREIADADPLATIDERFVPAARAVAARVRDKRGLLPALLHPYESGRMPGQRATPGSRIAGRRAVNRPSVRGAHCGTLSA